VALARSVDRIASDLSLSSGAPPASPTVSAQHQDGGLSLRFNGPASPSFGLSRTASAALQETRFAQARGLPLDRSTSFSTAAS